MVIYFVPLASAQRQREPPPDTSSINRQKLPKVRTADDNAGRLSKEGFSDWVSLFRFAENKPSETAVGAGCAC